MKKGLLILSLSIIALNAAFSQVAPKQSKFVESVDVLAGVVPNSDYNAVKFDLGVSNMLFKVVGFYTSFEIGVQSNYFTNIWGINITLLRFLYLFGGVDLFTSYGVISSLQEKNSRGIRKEAGLGLYPFKNLTIRTGYSLDVGFTVTAGYRIQFRKKKDKYRGFINQW